MNVDCFLLVGISLWATGFLVAFVVTGLPIYLVLALLSSAHLVSSVNLLREGEQ